MKNEHQNTNSPVALITSSLPPTHCRIKRVFSFTQIPKFQKPKNRLELFVAFAYVDYGGTEMVRDTRNKGQKAFEEVAMNGVRRVSIFGVVAWLAMGVGCTGEAGSGAKPKYTGPVIVTEEIDPVEKPLSGEPGAVAIPLDQISAYQNKSSCMLRIGKDQLGRTLPEHDQGWVPLLTEVCHALKLSSPKEEVAPPGFAVIGTNTDFETFQKVHAVLVKKQPRRKSFQAGSEITLIFFAYEMDPYTTLHRVDRVGNRVEIRYQFNWHGGEGRGDREYPLVALIPLGKLKAGTYHVNYVKSALERKLFGPDFVPEDAVQKEMEQELKDRVYKPMSREKARQIVCNSFSFTVEEK